MREYIVIYSNADDVEMYGTEDLERKVTQKLDEGWDVVGGVCMCSEPISISGPDTDGEYHIHSNVALSQAMIRG